MTKLRTQIVILALLTMHAGFAMAADPVITLQPADAEVEHGRNLWLYVTATTSSGTLSYQWYEGVAGDTSKPVGNNSPNFLTSNLTADTRFWVRVSNGTGSTDSRVAEMTVAPSDPERVTATSGLFQDRIRVTWDASETAVSYKVYRTFEVPHDPGLHFSTAVLIATVGTNAFNDTTTTSGETAWYYVTGVDAEGDEGPHDRVFPGRRDGLRAAGPLDGSLIPVRDANDFVFDSQSGKLFISTANGHVEQYDLGSQSVVQSFRPGGQLVGIDISPDDAFLLAADYIDDQDSGKGFVHRIDTGSGAVTPFEFDLDSGEGGAVDVCVFSNASALVTTNFNGSGSTPLRKLNPGTGVYTIRTDVPGAGHPDLDSPARVFRNASRSHSIVTEDNSNGPWFSYDPASDTFGSILQQSGHYPRTGSISRNGDLVALRAYPAFKVFQFDGTLLHTSSDWASGMRFSPVIDELYVVNDQTDEIRAYDTNTWQLLYTIPIPGGADGSMEISPDGHTLALVTGEGVRVLDISDHIPDLPTDPPVNLSATDDSGDHVTVSWDGVSGATSYKLYRHTADDSGAATELAGGISETSFVDTAATIGVTYHYWVKATNLVGDSEFSNSTTGIRVPPAVTITIEPSDIRVESGSFVNLTVSATTNSGTLSYQWYQGALGDTSNPVGFNGANYSAANQTANTSFWVRISNGTVSVDSRVSAVVVILDEPKYVTATDGLFQDRIRLSWDPVPGVVNYRVYRSQSPSFPGATLMTTTTSLRYDDTGAVPGTRYYYFVTAVDADGDEGDSDSSFSLFRDGLRATGPLDGSLIPIRDAEDFVFDEQNGKLFISTESGFVEEYDIAGRNVPKSFFIGGRLHGIDNAPDDSFLLVANSTEDPDLGQGMVYRIDRSTDNLTPLAYSLEVGEGGSFDVGIFSGTSALVTTDYNGSGTVPLRELDPATGTFTQRADAPGQLPGKVRNRSLVLRNSNRAAGAILESDSSAGPWFTFNPGGDTFGSRQILNSFQRWGAISRDGSLIAMSYAPKVKVFNSSGGLVRDLTGITSASGMRFSPALNELYVVDYGENIIRGFSTATWQTLFTIPVPGGIDWNFYFGEGNLEISPDGRTLALATAAGIRLFDLSGRFLSGRPEGITATDNSTDDITVSWNAVAGATHYSVFRGTSNDPDTAVLVADSIAGTSFEDTTAVVGTPYYYWVKAGNDGGESSDFSEPDTGLRILSAPIITTQPADQSVVRGDPATLSVGASANAGSFIYAWYRGAVGDTSTPVGTGSASETFPNQTQSGTYWVRVSNAAGNVDSRAAAVTVTPRAPDGVQSIDMVTGVRINWNAVAGVGEYRIFRGSGSSGISSSQVGTASGGTTYTDTTGGVGTTYYYFVRAFADGNLSPFSGSVTGRKLHPPPSGFQATNGFYDDKVRVSWSEIAGAVEYIVFRNTLAEEAGAEELDRVSGTESLDDISATPGQTNYYSVRAVMSGGGESALSEWIEGSISAVPTFLPDEKIGKSPAAMLGDEVYNTSGLGQTIRVKSKRRKLLRFYCELENDGASADTLTVAATRGNRLFRANYFEKPADGGRLNVTAAVITGNYIVALGPGELRGMQLDVKRKGKKNGRLKRKVFSLIAGSQNAPDRKDAVKGKAESG